MKIAAFTQTELDYLEIVCNFTDDEQQLFWLRSKDISLEQCAEALTEAAIAETAENSMNAIWIPNRRTVLTNLPNASSV